MPCIPEKAFLTIWGRTENSEGIAVSRWGGYDRAHVCKYGDAYHCRTWFANE